MIACLKVKRHDDNYHQTFCSKNGGVLLEELIAFCDGKSNAIHHFSAKELLRATNYYDARQIFVQDAVYQLYKGSLKDRPIFVKKLKIAIGLANAVAYLHTAFSRPVIHRGSTGWWVPPEYWARGYITKKVDVYQFGLFLFELLSGKGLVYLPRDDTLDTGELSVERFIDAVDSRIKNEGIDLEQLSDFATLIVRCTSYDEENRPTMIEVGKELKQIDQSFTSLC
ncbi:hypothetical protein QUC31_009485 [Theobroma cacao]